MKRLIYQYYYELPQSERTHHIINDEDRYYEYSKSSIKAYADKCNADYKFINERHPISPFYGIFLPFTEKWCYDYDVVCWIDSDILSTKHAKDIFNEASNVCISANFMNTQSRWKENSPFDWWSKRGHINSGVVVFPNPVYEFVSKYVNDLEKLHNSRTELETSLGNFDQAIVNKIVKEMNVYKELDDSLNYHLTRKPHDVRFKKDLIHYHRKNKFMMKSDFTNENILK